MKPDIDLNAMEPNQSLTHFTTVAPAGIGRAIGTILNEATRLLTNNVACRRVDRAGDPYGDGRAGSRIVNLLMQRFGR